MYLLVAALRLLPFLNQGKDYMKQGLCVALVLAAFGLLASAADKAAPTQVERGREVFLSSSKVTACATCHAMAGLGTAVAPDLTTMASFAPPRGFVATMRMSMTEKVLLVKTADGAFPAVLKQEQSDQSEFFDLGQTPPVLRKLTAKQIVSSERDQKWQHPPASVEYTSQELADLVGFLKWAATGSQKEIKPSEVD